MDIIRNIVGPLIGSLREWSVGPCFDFVFNETPGSQLVDAGSHTSRAEAVINVYDGDV